jgi:uncharacterized membrane protein YcaP (DUF421 family)
MMMLNEIWQTVLQSLFAVVVLFGLTRLMGKKQVSQLTTFDYVVGITIGSIAKAIAVEGQYTKGITSLILFALFPIILSLISLKSRKAQKILDGIPAILIQNGKIVKENLKKSKFTINQLLKECRIKDVFDITEIEFAILETNGQISIQKKSQNQPLTPKDMKLPTDYKGLCLNIIIDGKIIQEHLSMAERDINWILDELKKQNITDIRNVLLAYFDSNNQFIVHTDHKEESKNPLT